MSVPESEPIAARHVGAAYDRHMAGSRFDGEILWPGHAVAGEVDAVVESIAKFVRDYPHAATAYVLVDVVEDGIDLHYVAKADAEAVARMGGGTVQDAMSAFLKEGDRLPKLRAAGQEMEPRFVIRTTDRSRPRTGGSPRPEGLSATRMAGLGAPKAGRFPGRNEPCLCGSGRKFKRCCGR